MSEITDILVILDRSGSMMDRRTDHEGGLQSFVSDQKTLEGDARLTLIQFDSMNPCEIIFAREPITDVDEMKIQLIPRGDTPLLDAIGKATALMENKQATDPSARTIAMVITDGYENASTEWTKDRVRQKIAELEAKNWVFLFLAANIDAFSEAASLGIPIGTTTPYQNTTGSINASYSIFSNKVGAVRNMTRSGTATGQTVCSVTTYSDQEREDIASGNKVVFDGGSKLVQDAENEEKK